VPDELKELAALPAELKVAEKKDNTMVIKVRAAKIRAGRQQNMDRDHFERLNYLHQLSLMAYQVHPPLARLYISEMKRVSRRTVIRMSQAVRNSYCRKCLRPTLAIKKHRIKRGRRHTFVMARCRHCFFMKRFVIRQRL